MLRDADSAAEKDTAEKILLRSLQDAVVECEQQGSEPQGNV